MIAKGHDYPLVTLVGILNADALGADLFMNLMRMHTSL